MSKNICSVCNKEFEDKYFDKKQNKCILHCEKDDWYDLNDNNEKDWSKSDEKIKYFWLNIRKHILDTLKDPDYRIEYYYVYLSNIVFPKFEKFYRDGNEIDGADPEWNYNFCDEKTTFNINGNYDLKNIEGFYFNNSVFLDIVDFSNYEFKELFFKDVVFNEMCQFEKTTIEKISFKNNRFNKLNISNINFEKVLNFDKESSIKLLNIENCKIKELLIESDVPIINLNEKEIDKLVIKSNNLKSLTITNSIINKDFLLNNKENNSKTKLDLLNFKESTFNGKVKIQFYNCIENANFYNTKFEDLADFYQSKFEEVNFERTDFKKISVFSECEFYGNVDFKYTKFLGIAIFRDTVISRELDLRNSIFDDEANFLDITSKKREMKKGQFVGQPKDIEVANRETARIIKNFYDNSNNIIEANRFYKLEMEKREKELNLKNNFFEWIIFKFHKISSNHSQDWTLALFWIINLTFFYSYLNIQPNDKILVFKIIFSCIPILVIACMTIKIPEENKERRWLTTIPTTIVCYGFYGYLVETDWQLSEFSKNLNPFSIMRGDEPITLGTLIFKIIIAYLIYQLIISIRQNTRRK